MSSLLRFFFQRRMARFLPGGWFAVLLLNPRSRALLRSLFQRGRSRIARR